MFKLRTRPKYTDQELRELYEAPWDFNPEWVDHDLRRTATLEVIERLPQPITGADLSCGDGWTAAQYPQTKWYLGDYAPGWPFMGPIETTIELIPSVDMFILTETLEHLDDPQAVLAQIRRKSHSLVLSTPLMTCRDENPQHYWSWDAEAVEQMVRVSGWSPVSYRQTAPDVGYVFQIWGLV